MVLPLTDMGNSERFVRDHSRDIRYSTRTKTWLVWSGSRWTEDPSESEIQNRAKMTVRSIPQEVTIDPALKEAILKFAVKSETLGRINAMVKLARSAPQIQIDPDQFDANPWLLNCPNGIVDLRTGNLLSHNREHFMTLVSGIEYRPEADAPLFLQFLNEIMGGNERMVDFLQRAFGYALSGTGFEQCLFFFVGHGSNGKTTLIEVLRKVLGGYARHTPTATLIKNNMGIRNDLARLKGARFVTASEIGRGKELDEATTKLLTGEDPVTSRFLFREFFEYRPSFKLFLIANHSPEIRGNDFGIWRRILLIPFPVTISAQKVDKHLAAKLEQELPGILSWLVKGCLKWQKEGLMVPPEVRDATQEYRAETDFLPQFLADSCTIDKEGRTSSRNLYEAYRSWAVENTDEILTPKGFGLMLKTAGFKASKSDSMRYWTGLRLNINSSPSIGKKEEGSQAKT